MTMVKEHPKTAYEEWIHSEGIPVIDAYGVHLAEIEKKPWPRLGGRGAYVQLFGMGGVTAMWTVEIPGSGALEPERHLYEEVIYVYKGRGSMETWYDERKKQSFEWAEGSLFAPPMNAHHRLINGTNEPAILMGITNAPILMDILRDRDFIFNNDYHFGDRFDGQSGYFEATDNRYRVGMANIWETNFIPDVRKSKLESLEAKTAGGLLTQFEMGGNALIGHITDWPVGRYHKAHHHAAGAVLVILRSVGYSLMWPSQAGPHPYTDGGEDSVIKVDWKEGTVFGPPSAWFHQHFNTGREPARQLAIRHGSRIYPLGFHVAAIGREDGVFISYRDGGTLIEHEDEDPQIRPRFIAALEENGVECQMPPVTYRP